MRAFWIAQAGIGAVAIGASAVLGGACSSTAGGPVTSTDTSTDTDPWTSTDILSDDPGGPNDTATSIRCDDCACLLRSWSTPAGCADTCDSTLSGATAPDYCNGSPALPPCAMCIAQRCGVSDLTMCY